MAPTPRDGTYCLINKKATNIAFDLSVQDQKSIIGYNRNRGSNQMWNFRGHSDGDGTWTIQSVYNNKYLDIEIPGFPNDGVRLVVVDATQPAKWDIRYDDQFQGWRIIYHGTDSNADLSGSGNPANFTPVIIWHRFPAAQNQVWALENA